jgi:hypothetical protein
MVLNVKVFIDLVVVIVLILFGDITIVVDIVDTIVNNKTIVRTIGVVVIGIANNSSPSISSTHI